MVKRRGKRKYKITLIDILSSCFVLTIVIYLATDSLSKYTRSREIFAYRDNINLSIVRARDYAIRHSRDVSICPSVSGKTCEGQWSDGLLVFQDNGYMGGVKQDGILNGQEKIVFFDEYIGETDIRVKNYGNLSDIESISFDENGQAMENGRASNRRVLITVCDRSVNDRLTRGLILTGTGRLIRSRDTDNDGVHEGILSAKSGQNNNFYKNLRCW